MAELGTALVSFQEGPASGRGRAVDEPLYRLATRALVAEERLREAVRAAGRVAVRLRRPSPAASPASRDRQRERLRAARTREAEAREQLAMVLQLIAATAARSRAGQAIKLQLAIQFYGTDLAGSDGEAIASPVPELLQSLLADLAGR